MVVGLFVRGLRRHLNESGPVIIRSRYLPLALLAPPFARRLSWKLIAVNSNNNGGFECVFRALPLLYQPLGLFSAGLRALRRIALLAREYDAVISRCSVFDWRRVIRGDRAAGRPAGRLTGELNCRVLITSPSLPEICIDYPN